MGKFAFNPDRDVPDLSGKVIFITGGTTGLGENSLLQLVKHNPKAIYFTGRNTKSANDIIAQAKSLTPKVGVIFLQCDFTDLQSVKSAAENFLASSDRLDILMCNAGIMAVPAAKTRDGYEIQFGTNHIAHALLVKKLLPSLQQAPAGSARIVINTSLAFKMITNKEGIMFDTLRTDGSSFGVGADWLCYGQSKLANVLHMTELARRYPEIKTVTIHPGVVNTGLVSDLPFFKKLIVRVTNPMGLMTPAEGAYNQVWAAVMPEVKNGEYYEPVGKVGARTDHSNNAELGKTLWDWTESELRAFE